jgi:hypothetical protein
VNMGRGAVTSRVVAAVIAEKLTEFMPLACVSGIPRVGLCGLWRCRRCRPQR